jgi:hypothetical protein
MANQHLGDNPFHDDVRDREAPSRAEFQILQQSVQWLQETLEHLQAGFNQPPRDRDALEDDGIRVRAIHHPRPAPIYQPQPYDDNISDEHADEVYDREYGVERGEGGHRGARVGARYEGLRHGGAGHRDAYGEQRRRQEYGRKSPRSTG